MKKALVTGCAGFIGAQLTRLLIRRGYYVIGFDNFSKGTAGNLSDFVASPQFDLVPGDIRFAGDLEPAFARQPNLVFHLAARHFIPECIADPSGTYEINIVGTQRVWEAAKQTGAKRFVFVSTGDVYKPSNHPHSESDVTEPFNAYGISKLTSERTLSIEAQAGGPELVIGRMFNVYGPGETNPHLLPEIIRQVHAGVRVLELGNLWPVRDYIYVADAAEALIRLAEIVTPPPVANVGTGGGWTVEQLIALLSNAISTPIRAISTPEKCRKVERDSLRPDISRLVNATQWRPAQDMMTGLRETVVSTCGELVNC